MRAIVTSRSTIEQRCLVPGGRVISVLLAATCHAIGCVQLSSSGVGTPRRRNRRCLLHLAGVISGVVPEDWTKMRLERRPVSAFFSLVLVALLAINNVHAALLFQDHHAGANGEETIYRFEASAPSASSMVEQSKAVKVATVWAAQYYGIGNLRIANAQERSIPIHYWLIAFTAPGQSNTYYSIVLPNGSVVEPRVSRQNFIASANPIDVTKDAEMMAPVKGLEIHGEIVFEYGWGKGLRYYGPYAPNPGWYLPSPVARPAP